MKVMIGGATLSVILGDIVEERADVIVNPANDMLYMGGGVAGAIKSAGGGEIELEAMKQAPCPLGEVVVTEAGALDAKNIIHAVVLGQKEAASEESIRNATRNSLAKASEIGAKSIVLPAFGTGIAHFHAHKAAEIVLDETVDYLMNKQGLNDVRIVVNDDGIYNIFKERLEKLFSR